MQNDFSELKFKTGVKDGLPIGLGYLSVAFAFGASASINGLRLIYTLLISMTNLTSAGQLAGVTVILSAGTILEMMLVQAVINSRYFLMSISLSQKLDENFSLGKRLFCAFAITDEIFAVAASKKGKLNGKYFYGLMILPYLGWTLGTLFGAILGNVLPVKIQNALGIALYAMFIAIIIPPSTKKPNVLFVVALSAGISCLFYYLPFLHQNISPSLAIIISAIAAAAVAAFIFPVKERVE